MNRPTPQTLDPHSPGPAVLRDVRRVTRMAQVHADRVARRHGMTMQQWELLTRLRCCSGPADQRELCCSFGVTPPTLSALIDSAEERGWIRRSAHPGDRRRRRIELTAAGAAMIAAVPHLGREVDGAMTAGFTAAELDRLAGLLERAAANLREAAE
jgi:MarR family transcriptional regulator, transcriptional regulator for hemolysin